jgi:ribosomal protein S18 acetylase RimI-like enzyme
MEKVPNYREASSAEDALIAEHFYAMWRDNEVPVASIRSDWQELTIEFLNDARRELAYKAFVVEVDGIVVGSAGCQLFAGLYPQIIEDSSRKYGYIWGVYVEPDFRGQSFAKRLTSLAVDYLKSLGCTRVILHASPSGKPVYTGLGFSESNEMRFDL